MLKINFHYQCEIMATKKKFTSSKDVFLFAHFCSSFLPMKSFISEDVLNTSCETCNAIFSFLFFHSGLFLLLLSSALDNKLEYLNFLFPQKFLDSSFCWRKVFPMLRLLLKVLEVFLQPIKKNVKTSRSFCFLGPAWLHQAKILRWCNLQKWGKIDYS